MFSIHFFPPIPFAEKNSIRFYSLILDNVHSIVIDFFSSNFNLNLIPEASFPAGSNKKRPIIDNLIGIMGQVLSY